jgi:hypothetical protein
VEILPPIDYTLALREMLDADALMVLQSHECNDQIPAKAYEYLRAGKPILGLTDPRGDTADLLARAGMGPICRLDSMEDISKAVLALTGILASNTRPPTNEMLVCSAARVAKSAELAKLLDDVTPPGDPRS